MQKLPTWVLGQQHGKDPREDKSEERIVNITEVIEEEVGYHGDLRAVWNKTKKIERGGDSSVETRFWSEC